MQLIKINTTAYKEEDFYILTNINTEQLTHELEEYIQHKRTNDIEYNNKEIEQHIQQHFALCNNNYFEIRELEYIRV
jgi:cell division protein FtsL